MSRHGAIWRCLPFVVWTGLAVPVECRSSTPYTPPVGSSERRAIFDATRKIGDIHDRVWVVRFLKVEDG